MRLEARQTPASEFSAEFLQGMIDRMGMSYFKYGPVAKGFPHAMDALASMHARLERYVATGNSEWLIDAANFLMIEAMHPRHPEAHYRPTDSHESPGRISIVSGTASQTANTLDHENIRRGGSRMHTAGGFYRREGD